MITPNYKQFVKRIIQNRLRFGSLKAFAVDDSFLIRVDCKSVDENLLKHLLISNNGVKILYNNKVKIYIKYAGETIMIAICPA